MKQYKNKKTQDNRNDILAMLHLERYKEKSLFNYGRNNNIWLVERRKLSIEQRLKPYKLFGLQNWLKNDVKNKLDYLDSELIDPMTGIMGERYISVLPKKKWKKMVMLYISNNCVEKVNHNLSRGVGNIILYVAASILRKIEEIVIRLHPDGLYFLVLNAQYDTIIEAKMKLARTSIFFSNGYEVSGIGLELKEEKFYPFSYPLTKVWGDVVETEILKVVALTEEVKWVNVFVCSRFHKRIDGETLRFIMKQ